MWPAHAITLSRVPLAIGFWFAFDRPAIALALLVAAAITDALDGNVARYLKRRGAKHPDIGDWLDPLIDKVFVAIALASIAVHTHAWMLLALIGARELVLVPLVGLYLLVRRTKANLRADWFGKIATIAQFVALAVVCVAPSSTLALAVALATGALGLVAVVHYVVTVSDGTSVRSA